MPLDLRRLLVPEAGVDLVAYRKWLVDDAAENCKEQTVRSPVASGGAVRLERGCGVYNWTMPLEQFHPTIQRWFSQRFGEPTEPQREGWPRIRSGKHTLIAAPTGTGKSIAGYLSAIDELARQGENLSDEMEVLYISPLRALSNDVQKN